MKTVNLAEAKAKLSKLVTEAEKGEVVEITRRGKPVATLIGTGRPRKPIDFEKLRALTADMPMQAESAGEFIRKMRDSDRY